ncbi:MAG TPA: hypothetical protein VLG66_02590 [Alphaproteobacteria bacterium]|nr:hypothetical protein [Alphaproteobacteria bacterium]
MNRTTFPLVFLTGSMSLLSACGTSLFAEPKTNPVIEDRISNAAGTLATTAERRLVLMPLDDANRGKFCAEPSPDAAESIASTFKTALEGEATVKGEGQDVAAKLKAELVKNLLTSVAALTRRTQGLQFYRDGVFAYCQARMNGFMSHDEYRVAMQFLRQEAVKLIEAEIKTENWGKLPTVTVEAPSPPQQK